MAIRALVVIATIATLAAGSTVELRAAAGETARPFHMGFNRGGYAEFQENEKSVEEIYKFIAAHGDLIAHHLDEGVPWAEAFARRSYHPNVEANLRLRISATT